MKTLVVFSILLLLSGCDWLDGSKDEKTDISVLPATINLGSNSNAAVITVTNEGEVDAAVTSEVMSTAIQVNPVLQTLRPGEQSQLTISVDRSSLDPGEHSASVKLRTDDEILNVSVRFTKDAATNEETFSAASITRLCPSHIAGDNDYKGHGPEVRAEASLRVVGQREIWADLELNAKETRSDWTEADGSWSRRLWTAPSGWSIIDIVSSEASNTNYTDDDHELDLPRIAGGNLVRQFSINGDTGGRDVGHCTLDDVYMSVDFNPITVSLQEDS